jgi:GNAT superfamily N-acetyltransferase
VSPEGVSVKVDLADVTEANLGRLPDAGCKCCLYWEQPDRDLWPESPAEREVLKREWFHSVSAEFGGCGKLVSVGSDVIGYAQFAPVIHLPGVAEYQCGPPGEDAVFIACLYLWEMRGRGIGSALLEAILTDARARGLAAVETYARKGSANNPTGPLAFWLKHGFSVVREEEDFALVRREL